MKAILISDHAIWCALMMIGIKKTEVRKGTALYKATKKLVDEYGYAEFYVYCTKEKATRKEDMFTRGCNIWFNKGYAMNRQHLMNGKVPFKFRCYNVEEIKVDFSISKNGYYGTHLLGEPVLEKTSCLTHKDLKEYLKGDEKCNDIQNIGCAIHIGDLEIFDKPKELNEFYKVGHYEDFNDYFTDEKRINGKWCIPLTKAPQNFCYVEVEE